MRFDLRSFLGSLKGQYPNGLDGSIKLPCTHPGCRQGKVSLAANFRNGAGRIVPLLVHVDGVDEPVCYMCYQSYYGGKVEDYASFLVREHGVDRNYVPDFEPPPEMPFVARPAAPAPRPQAPAPRVSTGGSRPLPPRRSSGVAAPAPRPAAPAPRPQAPAPRPAAPSVASRPSAPALPAGRQAPAMQTRPAAPAPRPAAPKVERPAAPEPRKPAEERPAASPTGSRTLPPRRNIGVAAPEERPAAPAPRQDHRDVRPRNDRPRDGRPANREVRSSAAPHGFGDRREATTSLGSVLGDIKPQYANEAARQRAEAMRIAAADQKWLDEACARGTYRAAGKRHEGDGSILIVDKVPCFYPGGITGVIVGEGVCYEGTNGNVPSVPTSLEELAKLRAAGWKNTRTVVRIGNGKPVTVALCSADGVVEHALQSEVKASWFQSPETPAWNKKFVPTEDTGTVANPSDGPRRIGFEGFVDYLVAAFEAAKYQEDEDKLRATVKAVGLVRLGKLWDMALDMSAALDELFPSRVANRASAPAVEPATEVDSAEAAPTVA